MTGSKCAGFKCSDALIRLLISLHKKNLGILIEIPRTGKGIIGYEGTPSSSKSRFRGSHGLLPLDGSTTIFLLDIEKSCSFRTGGENTEATTFQTLLMLPQNNVDNGCAENEPIEPTDNSLSCEPQRKLPRKSKLFSNYFLLKKQF